MGYIYSSSNRYPVILPDLPKGPYGNDTNANFMAKGIDMAPAAPVNQTATAFNQTTSTLNETVLPTNKTFEGLNQTAHAFNLTMILESFCKDPQNTEFCAKSAEMKDIVLSAWDKIKDTGFWVYNQTGTWSKEVCKSESMQSTCATVSNATQAAFDNLKLSADWVSQNANNVGEFAQGGWSVVKTTAAWASTGASSIWSLAGLVPGGQFALAALGIILVVVVFRRDKVIIHDKTTFLPQAPAPQIIQIPAPVAETKKEKEAVFDSSILDELARSSKNLSDLA